MQFVSTSAAPPAGGHYSQAVRAAGLIFVAGQLPLRPEGGMPERIEAQTRQALANVSAILEAAGSGLDQVVNVTVYLSDIVHWPAVNAVYAEIFGSHRPARTMAVSPQLHFSALVELQVVALDPRP